MVISTYNIANGELQATLWAPEETLLKTEYYAAVIVDANTNSDTVFEIITDNEEVINIITERVTIPAGNHHGLIKFETMGTGDAKIFAIAQDTLLEETIRVVESADNPTELDLILPSDLVNVLADDNKHTGYVFLLNDFENPVISKTPISVTLTSNGEVTLPSKSVTIQPNHHYAKFTFETRGEGSVSASAPNLVPDEESINLDDPDEIELHLGVAPDPIPTDSSGEVYFWLERDGDPYLPPHDVRVTISIDKSTNLSFDSAIEGAIVLTPNTSDERRATESGAKEIITRTEAQLAYDSEKEFVIKKGTHYGKTQVFSSFDSAGDITISGLAESITPGIDEENVKASEILSVSTEKSNFDVATETEVFAFPDPAYNVVEIIVSSRSVNGPVIERDDESFTVFTNNKLQLDTTSTMIKTDQNYAIVKAKVIDSGSVEIFAERNESESDEIQITTSGKYVKNPELNIVPLPVLFNTEQDLFLITSSNEKIITDANSEEEGNLVSITSRPTFAFEAVRESESVILVRGTISELLEDEPEVHVASNAFTVTDILEVYNPDRKKLESLHPDKVYPSEPFPIINHINDLNENPVRKASLQVSSIANMGTSEDLFYFNQTGVHDVIFYEKNSVPIKSSITVKGAPKTASGESEEEKVTIVTYDVVVEGGQGSGTYEEDEEVTISAPATKDDMFIIKKKLVGWENLPYAEPTVTFEADENIQTRPIYENDYTFLYLIAGSAGGIGAVTMVKQKRKNKYNKNEKTEDDNLLELLKD